MGTGLSRRILSFFFKKKNKKKIQQATVIYPFSLALKIANQKSLFNLNLCSEVLLTYGQLRRLANSDLDLPQVKNSAFETPRCSMQHACRTPCHRCPWWLVPDSRYHGLDRFQVRHLSCKIASIGFGRMYHGAMQGSPLPPCPDHPQILTGARKMLENDHDISDHPGSFVYLIPVRNCQMGSEMIFHPWSLRHSSFGISLWWLHIAMIVSRRLELVSILPPPCALMTGQSLPGSSICR